MAGVIFGWFLLLMSIASGVVLFFKAIDLSNGAKTRNEGSLFLLGLLFFACGLSALFLLGVFPISK